jgi:hypothetical protein
MPPRLVSASAQTYWGSMRPPLMVVEMSDAMTDRCILLSQSTHS